MKKILVPVGNTNNGITNLRYAVNFASMSGASVYLVNIYKEFSKVGSLTKVNELILEESQEQLDKVIAAVDTKGVEVIARAIKGDPFDSLSRIAKQQEIDLMVVSPQSVDIKDEVYLGNVTGKIIKQTNIPVLVIPSDYIFRKIEVILMAIKRGRINNTSLLDPLISMKNLFSARLNLLQVITPNVAQEEEAINPALNAIIDSCKITNNATVFQGVLEHFQSNNPDLLCVVRRKRGFFKKLWEKNEVLKKEFHTTKPLLVLKGED